MSIALLYRDALYIANEFSVLPCSVSSPALSGAYVTNKVGPFVGNVRLKRPHSSTYARTYIIPRCKTTLEQIHADSCLYIIESGGLALFERYRYIDDDWGTISIVTSASGK